MSAHFHTALKVTGLVFFYRTWAHVCNRTHQPARAHAADACATVMERSQAAEIRRTARSPVRGLHEKGIEAPGEARILRGEAECRVSSRTTPFLRRALNARQSVSIETTTSRSKHLKMLPYYANNRVFVFHLGLQLRIPAWSGTRLALRCRCRLFSFLLRRKFQHV